jgi:hypothetical protein
MGEQQWDDVREHAERFLMRTCLTHSMNSFPGVRTQNRGSADAGVTLIQGIEEDQQVTRKLASIKFLTPTNFGKALCFSLLQ